MKWHKIYCAKLYKEKLGIPITPKTKKRGPNTCSICYLEGHKKNKCPGIGNVSDEVLTKRKADHRIEEKKRKRQYN